MSNPLIPLPIRLLCDQANKSSAFDLNRSAAPEFQRGDDIAIDIALGCGGTIQTGLVNSGAGGIASVTAQLFVSENDTNPPMMAVGVLSSGMNLALLQTDWTNGTGLVNAGTKCHASFVFPNSVTAVPMTNRAATVNYWLRITALSSDATAKIITFLDAPITVKDGPITALSPPPLAGARFFTVGGQLVWQILDPDTGLYHTQIAKNDAGVETTELSDTGY